MGNAERVEWYEQETGSPTNSRTRYSVLGPLEVWRGDRLVAIGGPQQKAALAILLLSREPIHRHDLITRGGR